VSGGVVLAGKSLATFLFSLTSLLVMTTASALLFGASWGNPIGVVVLSVAMSVSVVALTMIVIALARSERQADGVAAMVTFGLAIIGGNFLFVSQAPELLRRLALTTPNGWALRGFTDLSTGVGTLEAVLVPTLSILGFSIVVALVAVVFSRRALVQ
jgi:ABC-2 type transport system permease protein